MALVQWCSAFVSSLPSCATNLSLCFYLHSLSLHVDLSSLLLYQQNGRHHMPGLEIDDDSVIDNDDESNFQC